MTDPSPIAYASHDPQQVADAGHLRTLAICHYVWGGLTVLLSSIFIMHVVMGALMLTGRFSLPAPPTSAPAAPMPPQFFAYTFIGFGSCAVLLGWTVGALTIYSGRCIATQRRRVFSLVIAGINCASFPLGTLLGVFTFVVLLRQSVKAIYDQDALPRV